MTSIARSICCSLLMLAVSSTSIASVAVSGKIKRIYPSSNGSIYFQLESDTCNSGNAYYTIASTSPQLKPWYALLLVTAESGSVVTVNIDDSPVCGTADNKPINYVYRQY